jgi:TM2 domain-containing membrane protein YozV/DNA-directed RNA polymerase subunit M/transcription elongation factor TFIIS
MGFCSNCGNWVYGADKICPKCGKDPNKKIEEEIAESEEQPEEDVSVIVPSSDTSSVDNVSEATEVVSEPLDDEVIGVDDASLEKLDEEIVRIEGAESEENQNNSFNVCPKCGSPELGPVPTNVDVLDALYKPVKYYCRNCGYEGIPFILDGEEAFQSFHDLRSKSLSENVEPQPKPLYGISRSFDKGTSKKPYVAAFLSFMWPGIGQLYNGQGWKGLLFFIAAIATLFFSSYLMFPVGELAMGYLLFIAVWVCIISDAYLTAKAKMKKE